MTRASDVLTALVQALLPGAYLAEVNVGHLDEYHLRIVLPIEACAAERFLGLLKGNAMATKKTATKAPAKKTAAKAKTKSTRKAPKVAKAPAKKTARKAAKKPAAKRARKAKAEA